MLTQAGAPKAPDTKSLFCQTKGLQARWRITARLLPQRRSRCISHILRWGIFSSCNISWSLTTRWTIRCICTLGLASQLAPHMAPMLTDGANHSPTACELFDDFFPQSLHASLRTPQSSLASLSVGISSAATNLANGMALIHSPVPTPMEWTRIGLTESLQNISQPTP
jgi:hypothetical protein